MTTSEQQPTISIANPRVGTREKEAVAEVLDSGALASGDIVARFEREFSTYADCEHGVATTNGTTALHAALTSLGIGEGDTVLTTPFTFIATANAVRFAGAEPIFADIDPETYNLDPEAVRERLRETDVDAILAVHLYGLPAPLDRLAEIAEAHDIPLIEDCAQAHGARHRGRPVGSVGDVGCFSFYPTKNMTTGEGGMIVTDRDDVAQRAQSFIDHGRDEGYTHSRLGHNFRLSNIAAAIGLGQLERLPEFVDARRAHARSLTDTLAGTSLVPPTEPPHVRHAYNQFTVRCERRDELQDHLSEFGIDSAIYYPIPIHEQPAYEGADPVTPAAERTSEEVLSVPVHPELSTRDVDTIATALEYYDQYDE